ncbi:23S rRNA (pseudouridine(1915)-N(3))-methyltransferase RlmH [Haploplasma modicum]|jgi:23S rRNA (pseudouridine1915-N3)-methyltransferase|uniref:23S rRNA (pseudouridine(1915)-N(3))-methyltransferase RlmH n=1 Tax=Haploplasma modicum TaxID=2150 RepID=UPI000478BA67|nr:23S rRNA (pseudouridine(1915)-N(3))-methyltransferase RlmH [Haploplasma modicum]MCR1809362.1 23S rRNA (pseudouridine(1915)-N(3))-methyltransferase RlmH [Haploplasma modicum]
MIKIITVGKVRKKELSSLIDFYLKQIPRKTEIIVLKDEPTIQGMEKEGENILRNIKPTDFVITLEIKGKKISSEDLAKLISKTEDDLKGDLVFVIGGSFGLSSSVSERSNYKLSFSDFTFPHQLMQLLLAEQVYRAYQILNNHPYHK